MLGKKRKTQMQHLDTYVFGIMGCLVSEVSNKCNAFVHVTFGSNFIE
jgi:hypothetical protein